jgi:GTP-binding protein Era
MEHKAGFVNIIGKPNVGKSTLMNAMVGEKLSIITPKAQTTRHRILGIVNSDDYQIVFSDTPGIVKPHYELHKSMMKFVEGAIEDADIILFVTEVKEKELEEENIQRIRKATVPVIILINKIDQCEQDVAAKKLEEMLALFPEATCIPVSALHNFNIEAILNKIVELLPESPAYYPKDELTDRSTRFFISEIIREKILLLYKQEIPYSAQVIIETYVEEPKLTRIAATIHVARDTQKSILIGKGGIAIKRLGTDSRKDIETFIGQKVFLELFVKVTKDWRDDERTLRHFGYE